MEALFNRIMEHFELILLLLVLLCLAAYLWDGRFGYRRQRKILLRAFKRGEETPLQREIYARRLAAVLAQSKNPEKLPPHFHRAQNQLTHQSRLGKKELHWLRTPVFPQEKFIDAFAGSFWILFIIFALRSFIIEPFRIPSGSMEPTLYAGDFIVADKFSYGIRLPISNGVLIPTGSVKRGDVIVFNYPKNPRIKYIKRVVGLPGDRLLIRDGQIVLNGEIQAIHPQAEQPRPGVLMGEEALAGQTHRLQFYPQRPQRGLRQVTVPAGHYYVMGDNRDGSEDSRSWGFVADEHLVGKARLIWMNSDCVLFRGSCDHIGTVIR